MSATSAPPHGFDGGWRRHLTDQLAGAGEITQPGKQPDGYAHAIRTRVLARRLVVRIRRRALEPDIAAFEVLVFPDRHDLFDALDRVAARRERIARGAATRRR